MLNNQILENWMITHWIYQKLINTYITEKNYCIKCVSIVVHKSKNGAINVNN